jgi:hypothetical protein
MTVSVPAGPAKAAFQRARSGDQERVTTGNPGAVAPRCAAQPSLAATDPSQCPSPQRRCYVTLVDISLCHAWRTASPYLVFLLTIRAVGIGGAEVSSAEVLEIFALGRLLTPRPSHPAVSA